MIALAPAVPPKRRSLSVLDSVQIAQPCPADWEAMHAVEGFAYRRVRHCESCKLRVYNLSAMPRVEAEELLRASEGRMCVRLYRRHDGTVLTADCSYLRRAVDATGAAARRIGWLLACGFAAVIGCNVWAAALMRESRNSRPTNIVQSGMEQLAQVRPIARLLQWMNPPQAVAGGISIEFVMGDMATPSERVQAPVDPAVHPDWWVMGGRGLPGTIPPVQQAPQTPPDR